MPSLSVHDLGGYLREQRESARLSLRQLSELAGVSNPYLSQIERGLKKPSAEILGQLAKGLRISAESLYVRAGILEEREDHLALETAILSEPHLTERQKQVLLDIYESFRAENARESAVFAPEPAPRAAKPAKPVRTTAKAASKRSTKTSGDTPVAGSAATTAKAAKATTKTAARATKRAAKTTQKAAAAAGQTVVRAVAPHKETP